MKFQFSLFSLLFIFLFTSFSVSAEQQSNTSSKPVLTNEQKEKAFSTVAVPLEATFEKRKQIILKGIEEALRFVSDTEKFVQKSQSLSQEQKQELMKVINNLEKTLTNYQKSVQAAKDSKELMEANKAFVLSLKENKEQIRASIATVIIIGVEQSIEAAETYLKTAEAIAKGLEVCNVDTSEIQQDIEQAYKDLEELEALVNSITADGKVTADEYDDAKKAAKMSAQLTKETAQITADLTEAAEKCPYLNEG